ncbi:MAG: glycosyl hydrolase [Bacteroidota bacterium]
MKHCKKILLLVLVFSQSLAAQELAWPDITQQNKPWTRWWWPGSIVNPEDLTANLEKYKAAGLGGLEITATYGVKGQEDKFIKYLSPEWMGMLTHTLKEAERLDLGIDLANASGWPFGGSWVSPADACKNINYKTYNLSTGQKLSEKIEYRQPALLRPVDQNPDIAKPADPIKKNRDLQLYVLDQVKFDKPLPVHEVVAYSDSGQAVILTGLVTPEMDLDWIAPPGKWTIYALFRGWHGKQVERAGPGGEGDVIDHFSGQAINRYLKHFDTVFQDHDLKNLRGFFNDSYEVDDASGQADWTNDLFYEFAIRRGYDLAEHLPALFQKDVPDKNARILSDYRQTISDLILDKFTTSWTSWAHRQGKTTRNQAHGSPGNILDLYAAADIPETEGIEITRLKFASSAANVTGKPLISGEAATWLDEHFSSNLADIKNAADILFLAGINHLFYHGTCYSPPDDPWPGFLFYAAVELTPANPVWNDFRALNNYVARVQSFLQKGAPDNDILLYFPVFDRYAAYEKGMLEHFDAISPAYNGTPFKDAAETLTEKGYAWDYISDLQIQNIFFNGGMLETEGNIYKTLVLPECKYIPIETFSQILKLAYEGGIIILYGELPQNVSGWIQKEKKTAFFDRMKAGIIFSPTNNPEVFKAVYGEGMILTGKNIEQMLTFARIRREPMADENLRFIRRETKDGFTYFISNQGDEAFADYIPLQSNAIAAALFNPMDGSFGVATCKTPKTGVIEVYARLNQGESVIVATYNDIPEGKPYLYYNPNSMPGEIMGTWKVEFTGGGPVLPSASEITRLLSWTEFKEASLKDFSGTALYSMTFTRPKEKAEAWKLDLGEVHESASVTLNGKDLGSLIGPDYQIILGKKQLKKKNILEIRVSNLMANRIAYMDRNNIPWKKFYNINFAARLRQNTKEGIFDASSWQPRASGLIGPVTLTPMKASK